MSQKKTGNDGIRNNVRMFTCIKCKLQKINKLISAYLSPRLPGVPINMGIEWWFYF